MAGAKGLPGQINPAPRIFEHKVTPLRSLYGTTTEINKNFKKIQFFNTFYLFKAEFQKPNK
jgi:hypothetical protein